MPSFKEKDWRIKEETIDNTKKTERRVKITGYIYDVPVKFNKINQTPPQTFPSFFAR